MRCRVGYRHANTQRFYYFVKFRKSGDGDFSPVGCFVYRADREAAVFSTKRDALNVARLLEDAGHRAIVERVFTLPCRIK